jgi:asparagine synthetase B (glutamine-hydrolysing)
MCGIFGLATNPNSSFDQATFSALLKKLYLLSESRGKESAGLHIDLPIERESWTVKGAKPASKLLQTQEFKETMQSALEHVYGESKDIAKRPIIAIAHSRLVTNGQAAKRENNQPVRWGDITVVHNGIVTNVEQLWQEHSKLARNSEVDTEIIAAMISEAMAVAASPMDATRSTFSHLRGAASIAWTHSAATTLTLATNTGDIYFVELPDNAGTVFASEKYILDTALDACGLAKLTPSTEPLLPGKILMMDFSNKQPLQRSDLFSPKGGPAIELGAHTKQHDLYSDSDNSHQIEVPFVQDTDESLLLYNEQSLRELKRCTCCVLPETFPFIEFDNEGVCNYCRGYQPKYKNMDETAAKAEFLKSIESYRHKYGSPDVLVPFSGGRDSCYGLHLIKEEFGLNPITFTYDWGMVTDLARRNIARMCGQLGVQNILVSADIKTKRDNIRKNISAWLKKPDLGMVPLFMAGDKHFFKIVNNLKQQTGIRLDLWSANSLENTDFKSGFCGVSPHFDKHRVDYLSMNRKIKMATYYVTRFLTNPGYINSSLFDTFQAFLSYYMEPRKDFFFMFHHMVWNEDEVNRVLLGEYDFEMSPDSISTWRIGDGTAPFYNYIYVTANGFSEFDTFRSNQIREGQISREDALEAVLVENRPRVESLRWYLETVGLDFNSTIRRINEMDTRNLHRGA